MAQFLPKILAVIFWGIYADKYSRKVLCWVPSVCFIYRYMILAAWNYFELPVQFIFAFLPYTLGGGVGKSQYSTQPCS